MSPRRSRWFASRSTGTIALAAEPPPLDITGPIPSERLYVDLVARVWLQRDDGPTMADDERCAWHGHDANDRERPQHRAVRLPGLVALEPGAQWTLEAFQADVRRTLGEQLSDLIEADERLTASGLRVLRVTARGAVQGVPIQWVVLHFSDDTGRRVLGHFHDGRAERRGLCRIGHPTGQHAAAGRGGRAGASKCHPGPAIAGGPSGYESKFRRGFGSQSTISE